MKLGHKHSIVIPILASLLVILSTIAVFTYKINIRFLEQAQNERIRDNVDVISSIIRTIAENQVKGLEALSKTLQENKELAEGMAYYTTSGYVNPLEDAISRLFPSLNVDIFLPIDMQGQIIDLHGGTLSGFYSVLEIDTALKGQMVVATADGPEGWAIRALIPLFWPFGLDQYGVLAVGIRIDDDFARKIAAESNAHISFVHPGGDILASSAGQSYRQYIDWKPAVRSIVKNQSFFSHARQAYISTAYVPIEMANGILCLIVQQDTSKSYILLSKERQRLWYTLVGIIVIVLAGAFWLLIFVVRPLRRLEARTQKMIKAFSGDFDESQQQGNEIQRLINSFGFMHRTLLDYTRQLKNAKNQAEAANMSKGQFLANMSHEIRTPMNAILGFTDLLYDTIIKPNERKYLEAIKSSGKSLMTLIDDILDLSKIEAGMLKIQPGPVSLENLFIEIEKIFEPRLVNKHIRWKTTITDEMPASIMTDETRLRQILFNLIGNSVKFTSRGSIKLNAKVKKVHSDSRIDVAIEVIDTGIGIDPMAHKQIFEAFEQYSGQQVKQYGGTGLGLAISKNLVEMLGGRITVRSSPDSGSTFTVKLFQLECHAASKEQVRPLSRFEKVIILNRATLLVADDVETTRTLIKEMIRDTTVEVVEAENGLQAFEVSLRKRPETILMDLKMPGLDGFQALSRLRQDERTRHIPVIAMTAAGMTADIEKINASGFDDYLIKPFDKPCLMQTLERFIGPGKGSPSVSPVPTAALSVASKGLPPANDPIHLSRVLALLENEYYHSWELIKHRQRVPDIKNFAQQIRSLGEEYSVPILKTFGTNLLNHTNGFDIDGINKSLNGYQKVIDVLKSKLTPNAGKH